MRKARLKKNTTELKSLILVKGEFFMGFYEDFSKGLAIAALISVAFVIVGILKISLAMF